VFSTDRLVIEPRTVEHAPELCAALADESVGRYIGGPEVTTVEAMVERIIYVTTTDATQWGERWLNWVVRLRTEPGRPLIGRIEATVHIGRDPIVAEIAYVFDPTWSGRGYATEATAWMLDHLRAEHGVADAYATVAPGNLASIALLERLAFERCELPVGGLGSYDEGDAVFGRPLR
jgi:RimJ/RimL family protein N-acetyltransferase